MIDLYFQGNYDVSLLDCFDLFTQEETLDHDERPVSSFNVHFLR